MPNRMLIDSSHPEETRVVVLHGNRVEEFDFESDSRRPLRGNIYLAKVTRVEPSLQAAFIEFGGNRHGFLAFSEIHPDYYQIPVADRQALIEADERDEREAAKRSEERGAKRRSSVVRASDEEVQASEEQGFVEGGSDGQTFLERGSDEQDDDGRASEAPAFDAQGSDEQGSIEQSLAVQASEESQASQNLPLERESEGAGTPYEAAGREANGPEEIDDHDDVAEEDLVEQMGGGDALEELPERPRSSRRQYKIQEVIKRRQILLVQVVKEERGTKGAALTTYLSLAGRYAVLMPNTARGGGISRKITSAEDRKRLKDVASDLEVPEGMGVILRTAGASRTKVEIRRDFEYLLRVWEHVREVTLSSSAPALVHEEGSLLKRAIRDLYTKEMEEIMVAGEAAYREGKEFMRTLMPSMARQVKLYRDTQPLFAKYGVESQLDAMFSSHVTLKSGGYLVINQTEALVAIDVNSGRSTREHNIEDTALRTNSEAADEVARQLRLRDLAGLIVIDFIDMDEKRNNRSVEKRMKDALKNDRARIQIGRISPFGLLEMSRQRMRTGVVEGSSVLCPHCGGSGNVRATSSVALHLLRMLEDQLIKSAANDLVVRTRTEVALYVLNEKRQSLRDLERRFGVSIMLRPDEELGAARTFVIDKGEPSTGVPEVTLPSDPMLDEADELDAFVEEDEETEAETVEAQGPEEAVGEREAGGEDGGRRRRRRRRRGGHDQKEGRETSPGAADEASDEDEPLAVSDLAAADETTEATPSRIAKEGDDDRPRRRRRRRGGRSGREDVEAGEATTAEEADASEAANKWSADAVMNGSDGGYGSTKTVADRPESFETGTTVAGERAFDATDGVADVEVCDVEVMREADRMDEIASTEDRNDVAAAESAAAFILAELGPNGGLHAERTDGETALVDTKPSGDIAVPAAAQAATPSPKAQEPPPAPRAAIVSNPEAYRVNADDNSREKRTGWWSRAKAAFGSES